MAIITFTCDGCKEEFAPFVQGVPITEPTMFCIDCLRKEAERIVAAEGGDIEYVLRFRLGVRHD